MYGKLRYPAASNVAGTPCRLRLLCDAELLAEAEAEAWWVGELEIRFTIPKQKQKMTLEDEKILQGGCLRPIRFITFSKFGRCGDDLFYFDVRIQLAMALGRNFQLVIFLETKSHRFQY